MSIVVAIEIGLLILASLGCAYLGVAVAAVEWFLRRTPPHDVTAPVSLLKPLHGMDNSLAGRLGSFCRQQYDQPIEMILGTTMSGDELRTVAAGVRADCGTVSVKEVSAAPARNFGNPKLANLQNMVGEASHPIIIMSDSDIEVESSYLRQVVGALSAPDVGAVTCLYRGKAGSGVWSALAALGINNHFVPSVSVALMTGLEHPCFGSTIAIHRHVFDAIGGFEPFSDCLADDYAIGAAVRSRGWNVAIPPMLVCHICTDQSLAELWAQEIRWARTTRTVAPLGHFGTIVTHPVPIGLIGWVLGSLPCLLLAGLAVAMRALICVRLERRVAAPRHPYWLIPARDILSFAVFLWSFASRNVTWRGRRYSIDGTDGQLHTIEPL